jgi:hypothetical protein
LENSHLEKTASCYEGEENPGVIASRTKELFETTISLQINRTQNALFLLSTAGLGKVARVPRVDVIEAAAQKLQV